MNLTNASLFTLLPPLANIVVASFVAGFCLLPLNLKVCA